MLRRSSRLCPSRAVRIAVVGDNRHDLEMGRAAGAGLVVGILSGNGERGDLAALADHLLDDVTRLAVLLESVEV